MFLHKLWYRLYKAKNETQKVAEVEVDWLSLNLVLYKCIEEGTTERIIQTKSIGAFGPLMKIFCRQHSHFDPSEFLKHKNVNFSETHFSLSYQRNSVLCLCFGI